MDASFSFVFHRRAALLRAVPSLHDHSRNHHTGGLLIFIRPCPVFCPVYYGLLFFPDGLQSLCHDVIIHAGVLVFILRFQCFQLRKTF